MSEYSEEPLRLQDLNTPSTTKPKKLDAFMREQRKMGAVMENAMKEISRWFALFDTRLQRLEDRSKTSKTASFARP